MPVRIVWGQEDGWVPTDLAKRFEGLIPGATLSLVPGSGHLIRYDAPAALMNEIRAWLDTRRLG
jgi:pimeloyl-ACP methyl ester carboxylesterase